MTPKEEILKLLESETKVKGLVLEVPKEKEHGDYAFPCFQLSKKLKKNPVEIALDLSKSIPVKGLIKEVHVIGPYLNFVVDKQKLAAKLIPAIIKGDYGKQQKKKEKMMVEYSQPNPLKAFHVGHIRGTAIGESLARVLRYNGYEVVQTNYMGDTGAHIAKWIWCYENFHKGEQPPKDDIEKWIASIYVESVKRISENKELQEDVDKFNKILEEGKDTEIMELWNKTKTWSLDAFDLIYEDLDAHFDKDYFESEVEERGKEISKKLVEKGIAKVDEGATIVDLEEFGLAKWVLLRKDGTALYSAKDLALAEKKFKDFDIDKSIVCVGVAQKLHMMQLSKTLELMKFKKAKKYDFLFFEMVRLPTGKMSSRTGENILYSDLKKELSDYAEKEVKKRHTDWNKQQIAESSQNIAIAAIKFDMIAQDPNKYIVFDIKKVMDFEGETGPYIQYAHARICSVLRKAGKTAKGANFEMLHSPQEENLVMLLLNFPSVVAEAGESYKPHIIARYLLDLSQSFNEFYHKCPIIQADEETKKARMMLIIAVKQVLENGLELLGIKAPEAM